MGLAQDVNFDKHDQHMSKSLEIMLKMNVDEIENRERAIILAKNLTMQQFQEYSLQLLNSPTLEDSDQDCIILLLVKKYRKMSGDAIEEALERLQELNKKKYKLSKSFQKKNA